MPASAPLLKPVESPAPVPERLALIAYAPLCRDAQTGALLVHAKTNLGRSVAVRFSRELAAQLVHDFANMLTADPELRAEKVRHVDPDYRNTLPTIEYAGGFRPGGFVAPRPTLAELVDREEPEPTHKGPASRISEDQVKESRALMVRTGCTMTFAAAQLGCTPPTLSARMQRAFGHDYLRGIAIERAMQRPVTKPNGKLL